MARMAGSCRRASAFASCRKRASMPGVQAISGWSTLQARRRSRSLSHSSYTSAKPPRPMRRFTSYFGPSARARRSDVGAATAAGAGATVARSFVITVGEAEPHAGQKAAPRGISARHEGQVGWVVTARKIRAERARCNGGAVQGRSMLRPYIMLTDARAPHPDWPRARVPGVAVVRLAVPGSARLSGAAREPARPQASGRRERGEGRAGLGRWDEARRVVLETRGWGV